MAARSVCPRARPHLLTDYCGLEEPNAYNNINTSKAFLANLIFEDDNIFIYK